MSQEPVKYRWWDLNLASVLPSHPFSQPLVPAANPTENATRADTTFTTNTLSLANCPVGGAGGFVIAPGGRRKAQSSSQRRSHELKGLKPSKKKTSIIAQRHLCRFLATP